ncbi:AAA family ATPase [Microbacterium sp. X-17]|uniref:AAA family ATPase n=1 Tax=Microbacterium sp. X-17 TaxID=3144404 RepID=UPI0031F4FD04
MRIVVAGTHASGKSTLIGDFVARHPEYRVLPDPFDELADDLFDEPDARLFSAQLELAARRLVSLEDDVDVIAERGPLDFLAYLDALDRLGRRGRSREALSAGLACTEQAAAHIDLLALLPLSERHPILVGEDEDPELRDAMNDAVLELADDPDLAGTAIVELAGDRYARLAQLEEAVFGYSS